MIILLFCVSLCFLQEVLATPGDLVKVSPGYPLHIYNATNQTKFCVHFYTAQDVLTTFEAGRFCWRKEKQLTLHYRKGSTWYQYGYSWLAPSNLREWIWTFNMAADPAYLKVFLSGTMVKSMTIRESLRLLPQNLSYAKLESSQQNLTIFQQTHCCVDGFEFDPTSKSCIDCEEENLKEGGTDRGTKCMTYGFQRLKEYCYLKYERDRPLYLRADITNLDKNYYNTWFFCLRFATWSYKKLGSFCYNLHPTNTDLRLWQYDQNENWGFVAVPDLEVPESFGNLTYITIFDNEETNRWDIYMNLERHRKKVASFNLNGSAKNISRTCFYVYPNSAKTGFNLLQPKDSCGYGTEFNPRTLKCDMCPMRYHRNNKTGIICQKCAPGTYSMGGAVDCLPCNCPALSDCNIIENNPAKCVPNRQTISTNTLYPFNTTCLFVMYEDIQVAQYNDIAFYNKDRKLIGSIYWNYKETSWFTYRLDSFERRVSHSGVDNAVLRSTNPTDSNVIRLDMSDSRTLRFSINGVDVYRAVLVGTGPRSVNYTSVKYFATGYNRRESYENWGSCQGRPELCQDISEECEETLELHYCRTDFAIRNCTKFCGLCSQDFQYFREGSGKVLKVPFNKAGRQSLLRIKDRGLIMPKDSEIYYYYRWSCVSLLDRSHHTMALLCWNHKTSQIRLTLSTGDQSEARIPDTLKKIEDEFYIWDISVVGKGVRVSCQGHHIYTFPMKELENEVVPYVSQAYGYLEFQVVFVSIDVTVRGKSHTATVLSGDETTVTCETRSTKTMAITEVSWFVDGQPAHTTAGFVTVEHLASESRLTLTPRMGTWNITCGFGVKGEVENKTTLYSKEIFLIVTGCEEHDTSCFEINDCRLAKKRLCDGTPDCKSELDEAICQGPPPLTNHSANPADAASAQQLRRQGKTEVDILCTEGNTENNRTLMEMCYNRAKYSETIYKDVLQEGVVRFLPPCFPGLFGAGSYNCVTVDFDYRYGMREQWVLEVDLVEGRKTIPCSNVFGWVYVFLSSYGLCERDVHDEDADPPVDIRDTNLNCSNVEDAITVRVPLEGGMVTRTLYATPPQGFSSSYFQCSDGTCVPYNKVCNLVRDCANGEDERNCESHFRCPEEGKVIPQNQKCNGIIDCLGGMDECGIECRYSQTVRILPNNLIRFMVWTMGIIGFLLNSFLIVEFICQIRKVDNFVGFFNKSFAAMIAFGDALVAAYLISIGTVDKLYADTYCNKRPSWISSTVCKILGTESTFGLQVSLFSMTILSVFRANSLRMIFKARKLTKENMSEVRTAIVVMMGALLGVSLLPNVAFRDYFQYAVFYRNNTLFPGITSKSDHQEAIKFINSNDDLDWSWSAMQTLLQFNFRGGSQGQEIGFYGYNDICYFNYFVQEHNGDGNVHYKLFSLAVLLLNTCCFLINIICYFYIFRASRMNEELGKDTKNLKAKDNILQIKIACIVLFDSLIWLTFIILCLLHNLGVVGLDEHSKALSICILPFASVVNPIIFNGNMFFARPDRLTKRQIGLWVTILVGLGMALGLELQQPTRSGS